MHVLIWLDRMLNAVSLAIVVALSELSPFSLCHQMTEIELRSACHRDGRVCNQRGLACVLPRRFLLLVSLLLIPQTLPANSDRVPSSDEADNLRQSRVYARTKIEQLGPSNAVTPQRLTNHLAELPTRLSELNSKLQRLTSRRSHIDLS